MTNLDDFLAEVHTVAIGGHIRPDGDCVGSCLATYNYIKTCLLYTSQLEQLAKPVCWVDVCKLPA